MQRFREYPILIMLAAGVILFLRIIQGIAQSSPDPILINRNGKWCYADRTGKIVIEPQFKTAEFFVNGFAAVWDEEGRKYFLNREGEKCLVPYYSANWFSEGLLKIKVETKCGYLNEDLETVIQPQFEYARDFAEGFAPVKINGKWGFIDHDGKFGIEPQFDDAHEFSEDLASVGFGIDPQKHGLVPAEKYGFINKNGDLVISPQYELTGKFSEGLAAVKIGNKYGFIDRKFF